jgi:hypothetical protein
MRKDRNRKHFKIHEQLLQHCKTPANIFSLIQEKQNHYTFCSYASVLTLDQTKIIYLLVPGNSCSYESMTQLTYQN